MSGKLTTAGGLLYEDGKMIGLPLADKIAQGRGFMYVEYLVKYLEKEQEDDEFFRRLSVVDGCLRYCDGPLMNDDTAKAIAISYGFDDHKRLIDHLNMREAIKFYADINNYKTKGHPQIDSMDTEIIRDQGLKARYALIK